MQRRSGAESRPSSSARSDQEVQKDAFKRFCASSDLTDTLERFDELVASLKIVHRPFISVFPAFTLELRKKLKFCSRAKQFFDVILKDKAKKSLGYLKEDKDGQLVLASDLCQERKVLVVGGGPSGLRMAIEAQMSGAHVVVIERRQMFARKNIIYLWDYVVNDMKSLGCKTFYGDFCSGSRQIIAIQKLQGILLKIGLLLGVQFHPNVSLKSLRKPSSDNCGWRANLIPTSHPASLYEFDFFVDATGILGKRDSHASFMFDNPMGDGYLDHRVKALGGLRKGSRTFIAIAANFEMQLPEDMQIKDFGGISTVYKDNNSNLDLSQFVDDIGDKYEIENLTYYKGDTHYFLMTISEEALLKRNILKVGVSDISQATNPDNVNFAELEKAVRLIVEQATKGKLKDRRFSLVKPGKKDLTVFGYVAQVFASASCRVLERNGKRLFMALVGDSLIKPHWPSGNGIVKGFFSAMDTCHLMHQWSSRLSKKAIIDLLKEKENNFCCLKSINAGKHINNGQKYTGPDPKRRYTDFSQRTLPYLEKLYDSDGGTARVSIGHDALKAISSSVRQRADVDMEDEKSMENTPRTPIPACGQSRSPSDLILFWFSSRLEQLGIEVTDYSTSWHSGLALWALICMCEEGYLDMSEFKEDDPVSNNQKALDVFSHFFGVTPTLTANEISTCSEKDEPAMYEYLFAILQRINRTYQEVEPELIIPKTEEKRSTEGPQRESKDLLGQLSRVCFSAAKWKLHAKALNRSDSLPSIVPSSKTDEKCPVCKREIYCHDYCLRQMGHTVHVDCFRCCVCNFRLSGKKYLFDDVEQKYCCFNNHAEEQSADDSRGGCQLTSIDRDSEVDQSYEETATLNDIDNDHDDRARVRADSSHRRSVPGLKMTPIQEETASNNYKTPKATGNQESYSLSVSARRTVAAIKNKFKALISPELLKSETSREQPIHKTLSCPQLSKKRDLDICHYCWKRVYIVDRMSICKRSIHRHCFKCQDCGIRLTLKTFVFDKNSGRFLCITHSGTSDVPKKLFAHNMDKETSDGGGAHFKSNVNTNSTPSLAKMSRRVSTIFRINKVEDQITCTKL